MSTNPNFVSFVKVAAEHFKSHTFDYTPMDLPVNYFPIRFSPYLRDEAITDSAIDFGLDLRRISGVRLMAYHILKFEIEDCEEIENQRIKLADRLNHPLH